MSETDSSTSEFGMPVVCSFSDGTYGAACGGFQLDHDVETREDGIGGRVILSDTHWLTLLDVPGQRVRLSWYMLCGSPTGASLLVGCSPEPCPLAGWIRIPDWVINE